MRIASVETELYRIPRGPGLSSASARIEATSMLVARVRSEDGLEGDGGGTRSYRIYDLTSNGMPPEGEGLDYSEHARVAMARRAVPVEWVERTVTNPGLRVRDPDGPELERFFRNIPEFGGRVLRAVVNTTLARWRVVSVYFDRGMRGAL